MKTIHSIVICVFLCILTAHVVYAAGDATRGEQLYESRCIACHALDANRVGPKHRGVYGRKAGAVSDFAYSPALMTSKIIWSETTLNRWLTDPEAFIPGQRMNFRVPSADDRADLIAFLKRASAR